MVTRIEEIRGKLPKVDLKDRKILTLLTEDARYTLNQVASKVMLSRDAIRYRISRLQNLKVISGFVPLIDFSLFGYNRYHLFLQLSEMTDAEQDRVFKEFASYQEVVSVIEYSDRFDAELVVLSRSTAEFDGFFTGIMNKYHAIIDDYILLERVDEYCNRLLPQEFSAFKKTRTIPKKAVEQKKIDNADLKLLSLLARDARQSYFGMAGDVKLSSDAVSYRLKKLKASGAVTQYSTVTNLSLIGYDWFTLLVQLKYWDSKNESKFRQVVENHPNILMAMKSIGEWNLLIYVAAKSQNDFHDIVKGIRADLHDVLRTYETLLGYKEHSFKAMREGMSVPPHD